MDISSLKQYAAYLSKSLVGKRLNKFVQYDVQLFSCKVDKGNSLVFALQHGDPRIYYGESILEGSGLSSTLVSILRKSFANALVEQVHLVNDDRILRLDVIVLNEVFKQKKAAIVAELIPNRPNLILLDEEDKVIFALKMTTLDDKRPIVKGIHYEAPDNQKRDVAEAHPLDIEAYHASCIEKEKMLLEAKKKRKYAGLYTKAKNLKKSAKRKCSSIEEDIDAAKKHLEDANIGSLLLTYSEGLDCHSGKVDLDGFIIEVDPRFSASKNAEMYFKRYKKAKATIAKGEENLERAKKELEEAESLELALAYGDEELLDSFLEEATSKKKSKKIQPSAFLPFEYTGLDRRVLIGKNAIQNDFLTFHYASDKDFYWFHVKDVPGAHVIIETANPSNKERQFCCEFALLGTNLTAGEVQFTTKKNLRKGKTKGHVILGNYQSTYIRSISQETKKAYATIQRIKMKD